jgi:hypothetical protein
MGNPLFQLPTKIVVDKSKALEVGHDLLCLGRPYRRQGLALLGPWAQRPATV